MLNPLALFDGLFQAEPPSSKPLDAQVAKTCAKWDITQLMMDTIHEELQALPLNNADDLPRFQRTLVDYAAYTTYAALMKRELDRLLPGEGMKEYRAILDQCYGTNPLHEVFKETLNREMEAEVAPLREQFQATLAAVPTSWAQRVQQRKTPLRLVQDESPQP